MDTKIINQLYTVIIFLFAQTLFTPDHQTNVRLIRQTVSLWKLYYLFEIPVIFNPFNFIINPRELHYFMIKYLLLAFFPK